MKLFDRIISCVCKKEAEKEVDFLKEIYSQGKNLSLGLRDLYANTFICFRSIFNESDCIKEDLDAISYAYNKRRHEFVYIPRITDFDNVRKYA